MDEETDRIAQDLFVEVITPAEELPHLDLQEYIYDCAHQLYGNLPPGQSLHIVVVTKGDEQDAELYLAQDMEFQEVKVFGATVPLKQMSNPKSGSLARHNHREALEMLLLECKRLLSERALPPSARDVRSQILENARKCFPKIVEDYATGVITRVVMERDSKYVPRFREVPFIIAEEELFDIALVSTPENTLQAVLVHGDSEDLKIATRGDGKGTYQEAVTSLLVATEQQLLKMEEDGRARATPFESEASSPAEINSVRVDSPMAGSGDHPSKSSTEIPEASPTRRQKSM